jgi:hypothetical protein
VQPRGLGTLVRAQRVHPAGIAPAMTGRVDHPKPVHNRRPMVMTCPQVGNPWFRMGSRRRSANGMFYGLLTDWPADQRRVLARPRDHRDPDCYDALTCAGTARASSLAASACRDNADSDVRSPLAGSFPLNFSRRTDGG